LSVNFFLPFRTSCEIVGISVDLNYFSGQNPQNGRAKVWIISIPTTGINNNLAYMSCF
jgi:hypothetical protein